MQPENLTDPGWSCVNGEHTTELFYMRKVVNTSLLSLLVVSALHTPAVAQRPWRQWMFVELTICLPVLPPGPEPQHCLTTWEWVPVQTYHSLQACRNSARRQNAVAGERVAVCRGRHWTP